MRATQARRSNAIIVEDSVIDNAQLAAVLSYWENARAGRMAPARADIDPVDLFDLLPNLAMIKCVDQSRAFEFSLIGTGLARLYGLVTGQRVSDIACWPPVRDSLEEALTLCMTARKPVLGRWPSILTLKQSEIDLEAVFMPVSEDGQVVDRILGYHAITF